VPTYGYRCQSCEHEFETLQRMSDPPVATCPQCGSPGKRLFYPAGSLFKGSGFYKTDSRGSEVAAAPATDGAKKASDGAAPAAKPSADKPAAKPAADSGAKSPAPASPAGGSTSTGSSPSAPSTT
jgi:putative FmdB family regulatory protein